MTKNEERKRPGSMRLRLCFETRGVHGADEERGEYSKRGRKATAELVCSN